MKRLAVSVAVAVLAIGVASQTFAQAPSAAPSAQRERLLAELKKRGLDLRSAHLPPITLPSAAPPLPLPSAALPSASIGAGAVAPLTSASDLARRWRAFGESRLERREKNRAALVKELGPRLQDPRVQAEVKLHVTRVAELNRLEFLANNARTGADQAGLLGRVAKLRAKEEQRHRAKLAELAAAPAPSSSTPSPSPAPSGSGAGR
jgi:hypothetical protein